MLIGLVVGTILFFAATPVIRLSQLQGSAYGYAWSYLRMLSWSLPFTMVMLIVKRMFAAAAATRLLQLWYSWLWM